MRSCACPLVTTIPSLFRRIGWPRASRSRSCLSVADSSRHLAGLLRREPVAVPLPDLMVGSLEGGVQVEVFGKLFGSTRRRESAGFEVADRVLDDLEPPAGVGVLGGEHEVTALQGSRRAAAGGW